MSEIETMEEKYCRHEEKCALTYTEEEKKAAKKIRAYLDKYEADKIEDAQRARRAFQECSHGGDYH